MNAGGAERRLKNLEKRLLPNETEEELKNYFNELENSLIEELKEEEKYE